jgi:capsular polysaccharide export protein
LEIDGMDVVARQIERTAGIGAFVGIAKWKQKRIRNFCIGSSDAPFCGSVAAAVDHITAQSQGSAIAIWPSRTDAAALAKLPSDVPVYRIEDGFIRSVGLGANLVPPCSIAFDKIGIYYDPRTPSELEQILSSYVFDATIEARASALIAAICQNRITKYNLSAPLPKLPDDRRIILIAGQVMDDQSVLLGGPETTILDMLANARARHPGGYIVYKPHPDVLAGLRRGQIDGDEIGRYADLILADVDTHMLLDKADEVHTITSLIGFEALLRGCKVVTYGVPFYAGWGLTEDCGDVSRRGRKLNLQQLVAGALILYPLYVDPRTGLPCTPEHLLSQLVADAGKQTSWLQKNIALLAARFHRRTQR